MAQKPIGFYGKFTPTSIDNTVGDRFKALAGLSSEVGQLAVGIGKAKAAADAPEQAIKAAEASRQVADDGTITYSSVEKRSPLAWGSSQYNNTVINTQLSQRNVDARQRITDLKTTYKDDPAAYQAAAEEYRKATVNNAPIELQAQLNETLSGRILSGQLALDQQFEIDTHNTNVTTINSNIDNGVIAAESLAREGNTKAAESEIKLINAEIDALKVADPKYDAAGAKRKVKNRIYEQTELHKIDKIAKNDSIAAANQYVEDMQSKPLPAGYSPDDRRNFSIKAAQNLTRMQSRLTASKQVASEEELVVIGDYMAAVGAGKQVSDEETSLVAGLVKGTKYEDQFNIANDVSVFSLKTAEERAELLNVASTSLENVDELIALERANSAINTAARKDGITLATQQGIISKDDTVEFNPLILGDDPTTDDIDEYAVNQAAFQARVTQAAEMTKHYGVSVSPLTDQEATTLSNAVGDMTTTELTALSNLFGPGSAVWGQIADKDEGVFAQAAAGGNPNVMKAIFKGMTLKANDLAPKFSKDDNTRSMEVFSEAVGGVDIVYGVNDYRDTLDAVTMHYYGSGGTGEFDESKWNQSIQAVTGGVDTVRGVPTQLTPGVAATDLDEYFNSMTTDELITMGVDKITAKGVSFGFNREGFGAGMRLEPEMRTLYDYPAIDAVKGGRIKAVDGIGNYHVYKTDGNVLTNKDGKKVVFNVTAEKIEAMRSKERNRYMISNPNISPSTKQIDLLGIN